MPALRSWLLLLIIFAMGILSMGFQMVASRELAPGFGSSIIVWSFLISTFLIAFSLGSFLGGAICGDGRHLTFKPWLILSAAALVGFALNTFGRTPILDYIETNVESINAGLALACSILFFPAILALSSLGPLCVQYHTHLRQRSGAGHSSGIIYGVSTLGNILGVMLTALYLIPHFTLTTILYLWLSLAFVVLVSLCCLVGARFPATPPNPPATT